MHVVGAWKANLSVQICEAGSNEINRIDDRICQPFTNFIFVYVCVCMHVI